jgi:hypothetical protein
VVGVDFALEQLNGTIAAATFNVAFVPSPTLSQFVAQ